MPPKITIGLGRLRGKKKSKLRATFLACSNADGTERYPLLVIGSAENPRCFQGRDLANDGLYYRCSPTNSMNISLFCESLGGFDQYIGQTLHRCDVLFMGNMTKHGRMDTLPALRYV